MAMWSARDVAMKIFGKVDPKDIHNKITALRVLAEKKKIKAVKIGSDWYYLTDGNQIFPAVGKSKRPDRGRLSGAI